MVLQIKEFKGNAIALELLESFTEADALLIEQLFEEKLAKDYKQVNILISISEESGVVP